MPTTFVLLMMTHFVGDFVFQSDWMALNKSKSFGALTVHVNAYVAAFLFPMYLSGMPVNRLVSFVVVTWVTHFLTDALTSRATSALWFFRLDPLDGCDPPFQTEWRYVPGKRHWFFVMIGFDQLIHAVTLMYTYAWLVAR